MNQDLMVFILEIKIKDGAYVINLDEYSYTGTHWVALCAQNNNATYFRFFWSRTYSERDKKIY